MPRGRVRSRSRAHSCFNLLTAHSNYRIVAGGGDADGELGAELDGSVSGEIATEDDDVGGAFKAVSGQIVVAGKPTTVPSIAPSLPPGGGAGFFAITWLGGWWLVLLLLVWCCVGACLLLCCKLKGNAKAPSRHRTQRFSVFTQEADVHGAMAHRHMVRASAKVLKDTEAASNTGDEATYNPAVLRGRKTLAPDAPGTSMRVSMRDLHTRSPSRFALSSPMQGQLAAQSDGPGAAELI